MTVEVVTLVAFIAMLYVVESIRCYSLGLRVRLLEEEQREAFKVRLEMYEQIQKLQLAHERLEQLHADLLCSDCNTADG